jgi:molybdate transport system substrate-binding protein
MHPLKMISSMASKDVLRELADLYRSAHGQAVELEAVGGVDAAKRVRAGETFDVVVLARNTIDALAAEGKVLAESISDVARCGIAVAVRAGAAHPGVADAAAVRRAVMGAKSLSYSTGPSGVCWHSFGLESSYRRPAHRSRQCSPPARWSLGSSN